MKSHYHNSIKPTLVVEVTEGAAPKGWPLAKVEALKADLTKFSNVSLRKTLKMIIALTGLIIPLIV